MLMPVVVTMSVLVPMIGWPVIVPAIRMVVLSAALCWLFSVLVPGVSARQHGSFRGDLRRTDDLRNPWVKPVAIGLVRCQ
jgi:hypothetical protein